jgi:Secretion system C-terminal sorting domain
MVKIYYNAAAVDVEYILITVENSNLLSFNLQQNYPNPFNSTTTINYSLIEAGNVRLTIYNAIGSKVATIVNEYKPAGKYAVHFNGSNLASGIYICRMESGNYITAKKLILLK